jgi:hypothetical protein
LVSAVLAGSLVCAGVASGSSGAGPVVQVSSPGVYAESPVIAVDAAGDETVAWTDYRSSDPAQFNVTTATRPAGASRWSAPTVVSDVNGGSDQPVLAVAPSGAGVIAWVEVLPQGPTRSYFALEATTRPSASAAWTAPVRVASAAAGVSGVTVAIDRAGQITAVWNDGFATDPAIELASAGAATGRWSRPRQLAPAGHGGSDPQLSVDDRGDALVAWPRVVGRTNHRNAVSTIHYAERVSYRPARGRWQAPVTVGRFSEPLVNPGGMFWAPTTPTTALDAHGGATIIWQALRGNDQLLDVARRPSSARAWRPAETLTTNPTAPVIGTDAAGELTIAWADRHGHVLTTDSRDGTHWSRPARVPGATQAFLTWLSVAPNGAAILTWSGNHQRILVSRRPRAAAKWTAPTAVSHHGYFPQAALAADGIAALVWPRRLPPPAFGSVIDATTYSTR